MPESLLADIGLRAGKSILRSGFYERIQRVVVDSISGAKHGFRGNLPSGCQPGQKHQLVLPKLVGFAIRGQIVVSALHQKAGSRNLRNRVGGIGGLSGAGDR